MFFPFLSFFSISIICFSRFLTARIRILFFLSSSLLHTRVGIRSRISTLKKRSSIFLTFLPYPDPDSSTRIRIRIRIKKTTGPGSQKKTDADPQPGSAFFFFFFLSPLLFSWDGDLNLEPDRVTNFNKEKRKKVRRPLINASFFFLRKSLKFHCFSYFNNFLCLFRLLKTQVFFSLYSTQISANLNLDPDSRIRVRQRSASNDKIDGSGTA